MLEAVVRRNLQLIVTRWDVVGLDKKAISGVLRVQKAPVSLIHAL
jgi:hypothetical protein